MKLLTQPYRGLRRLLRHGPWFSCAVLAVLIGVEVLGRHTRTDLHDALLAGLLLVVGVLAVLRHRRAPLDWVNLLSALGRRLGTLWQRCSFTVGLDLRGRPPVPRAVPAFTRTMVALLAAWTVLLAIRAGVFPEEARVLAIQVCYLGYLTALVALWAALVVIGVLAAFVPAAMIHDRFTAARTGPGRPWRWELVCVAGYFAGVVLAARLLPLWVPFALMVLALMVQLLAANLPSRSVAQVIWRYRVNTTSWSMNFDQWLFCQLSIVTLTAINLALTACGSALVGDGPAPRTMPITTWLGLALTWLAPGALWLIVAQIVLARWRDPARPCRPVLHLAGAQLMEHRDALARFFRERGWLVRLAPARPSPTDVRVELAEQEVSRTDAEEIRWPLRVTAAELTSPVVLERLARRHEIQLRRLLTAGLEKLFKHAARRRYAAGNGWWVAPHLWLMTGLCRDTEEDEPDFANGTILAGIIGPPYHRVLPPAARHHAHRIFTALQVDLIFVEDGVGFRRFCRVLRMLFELFDIHGGRRRAEEMHFQGAPGVRVLIHDFQLNEPFRSEVYPEPDYENLGRARILHIFRDRGEQDEPLNDPVDRSNLPAPVLVG